MGIAVELILFLIVYCVCLFVFTLAVILDIVSGSGFPFNWKGSSVMALLYAFGVYFATMIVQAHKNDETIVTQIGVYDVHENTQDGYRTQYYFKDGEIIQLVGISVADPNTTKVEVVAVSKAPCNWIWFSGPLLLTRILKEEK